MSDQHLKLRCNELELELCIAASRIEALEAALREVESVAMEAIDHVGYANYTERIVEAKRMVRAALAPEQDR